MSAGKSQPASAEARAIMRVLHEGGFRPVVNDGTDRLPDPDRAPAGDRPVVSVCPACFGLGTGPLAEPLLGCGPPSLAVLPGSGCGGPLLLCRADCPEPAILAALARLADTMELLPPWVRARTSAWRASSQGPGPGPDRLAAIDWLVAETIRLDEAGPAGFGSELRRVAALVGELVEAGVADGDFWIAVLLGLARERGIDETQVSSTITSGLRAGLERARRAAGRRSAR